MTLRNLLTIFTAVFLIGLSGFALTASGQTPPSCDFGNLEMPIGSFRGSVCDAAKGGLAGYVGTIATIITAIIIISGLIIVIIGGYVYMTAGGNAQQVSTAKGLIVGALGGIALALLSYLILKSISPQFVGK